MKFVKYLVALAVLLCATANVSHAAGTLQFVGGGSSAMALELGQAAANISSTTAPCVWTKASNASVVARDDRTSPATDEKGDIWIAWTTGGGSCASPTAPYDIYSYMKLDSVVGDKCYFMVNSVGSSGCIQIITVAALTAGDNALCEWISPETSCASGDPTHVFFGPDTPIPADVINSLNMARFFVIGTDIRPEDAKFASARMFTNCGAPINRQPYINTSMQTVGLGYQGGTTGVGTPVLSDFSTKSFNVLDFNITGNDPINTTQPVRAFNVVTVGAQPMMVAVSPPGGTGLGAATDISTHSLAQYLIGVYGRSTDIQGPTTTNPVEALIREPLSGTYNVMEFSVPNSAEYHNSQEVFNCSGTAWLQNPLHFASANNKVPGALRRRVIGTGEMTAELQAAVSGTDRIGYFFWSVGNAKAFTAINGKYLTVNGIDPLVDNYSTTNGVFPTVGNGLIPSITFSHLNAGDYPIWSALRLVTVNPTPAGVTNLNTGLQSLNSTQHDLIPLASLKVWHSHFPLFGLGILNASNGPTIIPGSVPPDLCNSASPPLPESGGDAGGSNISKQGNDDFCTDYNVPYGLVNRTN